MQTQGRPLTSEETEAFPVVPSSSPPRPDSRLRGRIMAAGYRYKLLEESQDDAGQVRPIRRRSKGLLITIIVLGLLFVIMLFMFLAMLVSEVSGNNDGDRCNSKKLCLSPQCIETSASILKSMDLTVDPCQDIYQYACGGWMKETVIPAGQYKENRFSQASQKGNNFLRKFLEDDSTEFRGQNSSSMAKLKTLYRTCMDKSSLKEIGVTKLVEVINSLGSWPVVQGVNNITAWNADQWSLQDQLEASHELWGTGLFIYTLSVDDKDTDVWRLKFAQSGTTLGYPMEYLGNNSAKFKEGFLEFTTRVAVLLGGDEKTARKKMEDVYNLEKKIAKIFVPKSELTDPVKNYHKVTLKELQTKMGSWIDLKRYLKNTFNGHEFSDSEEILVKMPKYFESLSSVVEETDKEVMANYLVWNTIKIFLGYLTDDFMQAGFPLSKVQTGIKELPERWKLCSSVANNVMGYVSSAFYVDRVFSASDRAKAIEIIEKIRQEFILNLETVEWLDDTTKAKLQEKAKATDFNIGYPDWILDIKKLDEYYEKLEIKEGKFLENRLAAIMFESNITIDKYGKKPDKKKWSTFPNTVNGYYTPKYNLVTMPAAILQTPFFNPFFPKPFMYSTIGMVVGHELTHAFDNSGRMFDKHGNLGNQWTPAVSDMYDSHAKCMKQEYGDFSLQGVHANGKTTLNENIADNGALRLGYRAYKRDKETETMNLPGLNFTDDQLFFLGYAQVMCALYTPEYQVDSLTTDEHSYPEFRVKGVFQNMPSFYKAFNCPDPTHKVCRVW